MFSLIIAAITWVFVHLAVAGTSIRARLVATVGERAFRILFSVTSLAIIVWLVSSYARTGPVRVLWLAPHWLIVLCMLLMLPALVLLVGSVTVPNPTMVAGQRALGAEHPARGILRVTRHPMLWSFAIWAAAHMVMQGTLAAAIFFGAFLIVALAGMPSLDAKIATRDPQRWAKFAHSTSILPFAAIAQGRDRFVLSEIGVWPIFVVLVLWFALVAAHQWLFHISAWNILWGP
jgi:uncharacterized membrane protein